MINLIINLPKGRFYLPFGISFYSFSVLILFNCSALLFGCKPKTVINVQLSEYVNHIIENKTIEPIEASFGFFIRINDFQIVSYNKENGKIERSIDLKRINPDSLSEKFLCNLNDRVPLTSEMKFPPLFFSKEAFTFDSNNIYYIVQLTVPTKYIYKSQSATLINRYPLILKITRDSLQFFGLPYQAEFLNDKVYKSTISYAGGVYFKDDTLITNSYSYNKSLSPTLLKLTLNQDRTSYEVIDSISCLQETSIYRDQMASGFGRILLNKSKLIYSKKGQLKTFDTYTHETQWKSDSLGRILNLKFNSDSTLIALIENPISNICMIELNLNTNEVLINKSIFSGVGLLGASIGEENKLNVIHRMGDSIFLQQISLFL